MDPELRNKFKAGAFEPSWKAKRCYNTIHHIFNTTGKRSEVYLVNGGIRTVPEGSYRYHRKGEFLGIYDTRVSFQALEEDICALIPIPRL